MVENLKLLRYQDKNYMTDQTKRIKGQNVLYTGKYFEVFDQLVEYFEDGVSKDYLIETVRRPPSIRSLIVDFKARKVLLTKEYRTELTSWDYRLPGGKVFETLEEFLSCIHSGQDIVPFANAKVDEEVLEEAGVVVKSKELYHKSITGVTIHWDIYYYAIHDFEQSVSQLCAAEFIFPEWVGIDKAKEMCFSGEISEERSAMVLLKYLQDSDELTARTRNDK